MSLILCQPTKTGIHLVPASNAAKKDTGPAHSYSQGPLLVHAPAVAKRDIGSLWGSGYPFLVLSRVLRPSSAQPPQTHHWRLKLPRASGPDAAYHFCGAQGNSYMAGKPISFLTDTVATYSAMPTYSRKTKISQVSVVMVDGLISTAWVTESLPGTLQDTPFSHSFLILPKCPTPILGKELLSKFSLYYYPKHTFGSSLDTAP